MATTFDARAAEVFMRALDLVEAEREAFLEQACAEDLALRAEVDSLLAADSELAHDSPPRPEEQTLVGVQIGQYRLKRLLGTGGMGAVYEAEQDNPRRSVAVKIMRPGLGGRSAPARFKDESQVLARLRHPGIAQVYEAGEHAWPGLLAGSGAVPFFAMEFIEGAQTLLDYCTTQTLGLRQRLELVALVCDAVQHGHQKGVIHRDLKPGNILVDPSGQPKVIDFGVARTTDADVIAATMDTGASQMVGTLRYMSPEQCGGDPTAIDTRSDVYALGVVLYEVLTGRLPYQLDGRAVYEVPQMIREQPPVRPSVVNRDLRGDVETIILKSLEKDRDRRYASASGFAADIRRFMRSEPIAARPPSAGYQLRMFARRHPGLVGGVAAAFAALALGLALTVRQTVRANAALDRAEHQSYAAEIAAADGAIRAEDGGTAMARLRAAPPRLRGWEWHFLATLADQSLGKWEFPGSAGTLTIASPDGAQALVFNGSGPCSLRNVETGEILWQCDHAGAFHKAFAPDGLTLALKYPTPTSLSIRNAGNGDELSQIEIKTQTPGVDLLGVSFHPDGRRIATSATDSRVRILDWREQRLLHEFVHGLGWIRAVSFSFDGTFVAYYADGKLLLRNADSGEIIRELVGGDEHSLGFSTSLVFSPDGTILADARNPVIRLWEPRTGELMRVLRGHTHWVTDLAFSANGSTLVSAGADRTVRVWNLASDEPPVTLLGHASNVATIGLCMSDTRIVTGSLDSTVRFWDARARPAGIVLDTGALYGKSVSFTSAGRELLTMSGNVVKRWDLNSRRELFSTLHGEPEVSFGHPGAISPDERLLALGERGPTLRVLDASNGQARWSAIDHRGHSRVESIAFSPDSERLACTDHDRLQVRGATDGSLLYEHEVAAPGGAVEVEFSSDGRLLCVASEARGLMLLEAATGEILRPLADAPGPVMCISFSPDSRRIAAGLLDGTVVIWDAISWRQVTLLTGMQPGVWSVAFSPDGSRLAAGSKDRAIHLWDTSDWVELLTLRGHKATVTGLAWSRDGRNLASVDFDGTARVWEAPEPPAGH